MRVPDAPLRPAPPAVERDADHRPGRVPPAETATVSAPPARPADPDGAWQQALTAIGTIQPSDGVRLPGGDRLSAGVLRQEMAALLEAVGAMPAPNRTDRVVTWVLRTELRKLEALDRFMSGFIRG